MDPWSKVDYPRLIREASMVVEKLPEVNPPSGRVPGQGLLAAPILEARRWRNRGEIAKRILSSGVSGREVNIGEWGKPGGYQGVQVAPRRSLRWGRGPTASGRLVGPPGPPSGIWKLPHRRFFIVFSRNILVTLSNGKT